MSRWVRFAFIFFGVGLGNNLAADVITQPLSDPASDGFLSFLESGDRNTILTSLWLRIEREREMSITTAGRYGTAREIERPTAEQSITWAAGQVDGDLVQPLHGLGPLHLQHGRDRAGRAASPRGREDSEARAPRRPC